MQYAVDEEPTHEIIAHRASGVRAQKLGTVGIQVVPVNASPRQANPLRMEYPMKYAICNELFEGVPGLEGYRQAAELGYTGVEIAPFTLGPKPLEIAPERCRAFAKVLGGMGLEVIGLHWLLAKTEGFHLTTDDESVRNRTAEYLRGLVRLCAEMGGEVMVLGSPNQRNFLPPMTHDHASANAIQVLEQLVPALENAKVRLAIEPLGPGEGNFLNHASQARTILEAIGSPWVQLHLDVKAMSTEGIPIDQVIRENSDLMIHFHANDPNLLGPGMGAVDQQPIFQALKDIDYRGWVSVEVFDYSPGVKTILRRSMETMARCAANTK